MNQQNENSIGKWNFSSSLNTGWKEVKNKTTIVTRLFNQGHIDFEEAAILLKELVMIEKSEPKENKDFWFTLQQHPFNNYDHWENCSCNPKNGGSGVCGCVLNKNCNIT